MNLTESLGRQNRTLLVVLGMSLLVLVAVCDLFTDPEFQSAAFYVVPVSFFAWFVSRRAGLMTCVASVAITVLMNRATYRNPHNVYLNAIAWLALYLFIVFITAELRSLYERELRSSHTDALTNLRNRRAFFEALDIEQNRASRSGHCLTLAYIDLDGFKAVNDQYGHSVGDDVLREAASTMEANTRQTDVVARIGGDEFAVLMPETGVASAEMVLRKLQSLLNASMRARDWPVTFSMGAATFQDTPGSSKAMIKKADEALYAAKTSGRNRVIVHASTSA